MKINSIAPMTVNTATRKKINNAPSFGEKACVPGDEFQLSVLLMVDKNPKELLKRVKKASKDVGYVDALFSDVLASRKEELFLITKEQEKEKVKFEIMNAHYMYKDADLTSANASYLRRVVTERINELEEKLKEYDKYRPADKNKLKILGKVAKALVKKDSFDPNLKDKIGNTLIQNAIKNNDDELAIMIIKHKKFERPARRQMYSYEWQKFLELEKRAKSWF